jgi:hypothetical protein
MIDSVIGKNIRGEHIFMAEKHMLDGYETWIGTGLDQLLVRHFTLRDVLDYYIGYYPGVHSIHVVTSDRYAFLDMAKLGRSVMLDDALRIIQQQTGGDINVSPTPKVGDDKGD